MGSVALFIGQTYCCVVFDELLFLLMSLLLILLHSSYPAFPQHAIWNSESNRFVSKHV
jgi:hypothetical protein